MSVRIYAKEEGGITPYQLMQREDILNTVTSDATDKALSAAQGKALASASVETWWHTRTAAGVHIFEGRGTIGKVRLRANYTPGDTFEVNGTPVTAVTGGQALQKWTIWRWALLIYDTSTPYLYLFTGDAPDVRCGTITITAPAGGVGNATVSFSPLFNATPIVVATPTTSRPDLISASTLVPSTSEVTFYLHNGSSSAGNWVIRYIAAR